MSRTWRHRPDARPGEKRRFGGFGEEFRCRHCRLMVGRPWSGGRHRNHCPYCLRSRHVDGRTPGDRASDCGATMAPIAVFARRNGEQAVVHRCLGCGFERYCRIAADDDVEVVMRLPVVAPRLRARAHRAVSERSA